MLTYEEAGRLAVDEVDRIRAVVDDIPEQGWGGATPCEGWDVEFLVRHIAAVIWQQSEAFHRAALWAQHAPSYLEVGGDVATLPQSLERARSLLVSALDVTSGDQERLVPLPFGTMPAVFAVYALVVEYGIHRHDLETSLGHDARLHPDVVDTVLMVAPAVLPQIAAGSADEGAGYRFEAEAQAFELVSRQGRWEGGTPERMATFRGTAEDLALLALGRRDVEDPAVKVEGDADLAAAFSTHFPGL